MAGSLQQTRRETINERERVGSETKLLKQKLEQAENKMESLRDDLAVKVTRIETYSNELSIQKQRSQVSEQKVICACLQSTSAEIYSFCCQLQDTLKELEEIRTSSSVEAQGRNPRRKLSLTIVTFWFVAREESNKELVARKSKEIESLKEQLHEVKVHHSKELKDKELELFRCNNKVNALEEEQRRLKVIATTVQVTGLRHFCRANTKASSKKSLA